MQMVVQLIFISYHLFIRILYYFIIVMQTCVNHIGHTVIIAKFHPQK